MLRIQRDSTAWKWLQLEGQSWLDEKVPINGLEYPENGFILRYKSYPNAIAIILILYVLVKFFS